LFIDRLGREIAHAARDGHLFAVLVVDLDRFKVINDTLR
jgi:GGDEF domain-containing protein